MIIYIIIGTLALFSIFNTKYRFLALKFLITVLLLKILLMIFKMDFEVLLEQLLNLDLKNFIFATLAATATIFTNNYRWWLLTKIINLKVSFWLGLNWYFEAMFANTFFPSNLGGDALRTYFLKKETNHSSWLESGSSIIMERLTGFTLMFFFLPIGLLILVNSGIEFALDSKYLYLVVALSSIPVLFLLTYRLWLKIPFKIFQKVFSILDIYTKDLAKLLPVLFWTFITHLFLILTNIFAAKAVGLTFNTIPVWFWLLIVPVATLANFVVPAIKGLGAKEASYVYLLSLIGVSPENALAIAVTVFFATVASSLPGLTIFKRGFKFLLSSQKNLKSST
jgi:uncharacterized protein (TIRG00374 family)